MAGITDRTIAVRVFQALKNNSGALELHFNGSYFDYGYRFSGKVDVTEKLDVVLFQMRIDNGTYVDEQVQFWPKPFTTEEKLLHRDKNNKVCDFMEEQIMTLSKKDFQNTANLLSNNTTYNTVSVAAVDTITEMFRSRRIAYQLSNLHFGSFQEKPQLNGESTEKILPLMIWRRYASRDMSFQFYNNSSRTGDTTDKSLIFTSKKYPCFVFYPDQDTFHIRELMAIIDEEHNEVLVAIGNPIVWETDHHRVFWEKLDNLYLRKLSEQLEISQVSDLMGIEVNLMRTHLSDQTLNLQLKNLTLAQIRTYLMGFLRQHGYPFELINSGIDKIGLEAGTGTRWISIAITKEIEGCTVPVDFPTDTPLSKFVIYTMDSSGGIRGLQPVQYVENDDIIRILVDKIHSIINHYLDQGFLNPETNFPTIEDDEELPVYTEEDHMSPGPGFGGGGRIPAPSAPTPPRRRGHAHYDSGPDSSDDWDGPSP